MSLTIGHGNGHNHLSLVDFIRDAGCDSFGFNEGQKLLGPIRNIPDTRLTVAGPGWTEPRQRAKSTGIVTADDRENLGELTRKVSERVLAYHKWAPDRVLVASFYAHPVARAAGCEGIAHFELHPDATVRNRSADHPLVREYREALVSTRRHMAAARRDGLAVVLTGDLQLPRGSRKAWSPEALLADPLDLRCRAVGIDWICIDKRLRFIGKLRRRRLFDHTGFVAKLGARGR